MNAVLELTPSGRFEARPETVGTTEEELLEMANGRTLPHRHKAIAENMERAAAALAAYTFGHC